MNVGMFIVRISNPLSINNKKALQTVSARLFCFFSKKLKLLKPFSCPFRYKVIF